MSDDLNFEKAKELCETRCDREYIHQRTFEEEVIKIGNKQWMGKLTTEVLWSGIIIMSVFFIALISASIDYGNTRADVKENKDDIVTLKTQISQISEIKNNVNKIYILDSIASAKR